MSCFLEYLFYFLTLGGCVCKTNNNVEWGMDKAISEGFCSLAMHDLVLNDIIQNLLEEGGSFTPLKEDVGNDWTFGQRVYVQHMIKILISVFSCSHVPSHWDCCVGFCSDFELFCSRCMCLAFWSWVVLSNLKNEFIIDAHSHIKYTIYIQFWVNIPNL